MNNTVLNSNGVCPLSSDGLEVVCCEDCLFHSGIDEQGRAYCSNPYVAQLAK